ncbi:MAG: hypothetical protein MUE36_13560 [Acidimicrobiales bacterium]|jgi:hypothetical protein|nr:hypothetical protein [Acidimicrobiales bacterium]
MKRVIGLLAATALVVVAGAVSTGSAGAQATSTPVVPIVQTIDLPTPKAPGALVYAVHGLNLDGQTAQTDGGTAVTVCADGASLLTDFQFGEIAEPLALEVGREIDLTVFLGADADCAGTDPVISQMVTVPDVIAAALVATAGPDGELQLLPVVLDVEADEVCFNGINSTPQGLAVLPDSATLGAVHAANAGPVEVVIDGTTAESSLAFGESLFAAVPPDTYEVTVKLGGTPIVGPVDLTLDDCTLTVVYVVGNQPIAGPEPVTPTEPPAAAAVTARPAFTG